MTNNLNLREYSENNGLIEDYPYRELKGIINVSGSLEGEGVRKLFHVQRWVSIPVAVPANVLTYPNFQVIPAGTDISHWFKDLKIETDYTAPQLRFVVPYSGLYWIHWMVNVTTAITNNQEYFSELFYLPLNNALGQTPASGTNYNKIAASPVGPVQSNTWMRYLTAGDSFSIRVVNTEANSLFLTLNMTLFECE